MLEHVEDLRANLGALYRMLRPGGRLLVELPHDLRSLGKTLKRRVLRRGYSKFTRLQHLRFFSVRSLEACLRRTGFEVELCRPIPAFRSVPGPSSLVIGLLAPFEHLNGRGHNLEAVARKPST